MRITIRIASALASTALSSLCGHALAQDSDSNGTVNEIIVTAQKKTQLLQDVPVAITALNASALEEQSIRTASDLQSADPV